MVNPMIFIDFPYPKDPCMEYLPTLGLFWITLGANVGKYSIHGSSGYDFHWFSLVFCKFTRHVPSPSQGPKPFCAFLTGRASAGQDYTSVTFEPDLPRFGMRALEVGDGRRPWEGRSVPVVPRRKWWFWWGFYGDFMVISWWFYGGFMVI